MAEAASASPPAAEDPSLALALPVTETANEHTSSIDLAAPATALRMLRSAEHEIFGGWRGHVGLGDAALQQRLVDTAARAVELIKTHGSSARIVFTGCGTSGRLAHLAAWQWNAALEGAGYPPVCDYLVSGGDPALILSDELPEDDAVAGAGALAEAVASSPGWMLVGISCGLSAPYVAGQVHWALQQAGGHAVMVGFNPASAARDAPVEGWEHTVRDVVQRLATCDPAEGCLINPVIGPEPITGSTRMKGGSATLLILDTLMHLVVRGCAELPPGLSEVQGALAAAQQTHAAVYAGAAQLCPVVHSATASLSRGGRLVYLGGALSGVMGMMDASEMPDTYGSPFDEVRGFRAGGWGGVPLHCSADAMRAASKYCCVDMPDASALPHDTWAGATVLLPVLWGEGGEGDAWVRGLQEHILPTAQHAAQHGATVAALLLHPSDAGATNLKMVQGLLHEAVTHPDLLVCVALPVWGIGSARVTWATHALKWALNATSTIAQVGSGKVLHNTMVNVGVLNDKLFQRCTRIVSQFAGADEATAQAALLASIHALPGASAVPDDIAHAPISTHIKVASTRERVVPRAILMASSGCTSAGADDALAAQPSLRAALTRGPCEEPWWYWVTASLPDAATQAEYTAWLSDGHVTEVVSGGAQWGQVTRLHPDHSSITSPATMSLYCFPSKRAFNEYEAGTAKPLRADGLARFGPDTGKGVTFTRAMGRQCLRVGPVDPAPVLYSVTAHLPDDAVAEEFLQWLRGGHVADMVAAGALWACVVQQQMDGPGGAITSMYGFKDEGAFQTYLSDEAPRMRGEGLALFGPATGKGVTFTRSLGVTE